MKDNLTLVVLVIDASSSMKPRMNEVTVAVNDAIKQNREAEGDTIVSVYEFDSIVRKVIDFKDIESVEEYKYTCNGWTALYDGIGTAIVEVGNKLSEMDENNRPSNVQFMIITDGDENASKKFTKHEIKERIELQSSVYSWIFTYLGSNQDAILAGAGLGISSKLCANYSDNNLSDTIGMVSKKMVFARSATDYAGAVNLMAYSAEERELLVKDDHR